MAVEEVRDGYDIFENDEWQEILEVVRLKVQKEELEELINAKRARVQDILNQAVLNGSLQSKVFIMDGIEFSEKSRRTYAFSEEIIRLELRLNNMKKQAIKNKKAICVKRTDFLDVRGTKLFYNPDKSLWTTEKVGLEPIS